LYTCGRIASARGLGRLHYGIAGLIRQYTTFFFRHRLALAIAWLQMNVELRELLVWLLLQDLIDFFSEHALVLRVEARSNTAGLGIGQFADIVLVELVVDDVIGGCIPHLLVSTTATRHM